MCIKKKIPLICEFTEKVNVKKALKIANLTTQEIKATFWDKDELSRDSNEKWNWSSYILNIRSFLKKIIHSKGETKQTYKFGKMNYEGRLYVNGFGIQSLQNKIRNYICNDYYNELDIKNAHPCILLYLCEKNDISCNLLKDYCLQRDFILEKHNLSKFDILISLNKDVNKPKKKNSWFNLFIEELQEIKNSLNKKIELPETDNLNNPLSSAINKILLKHEGEMINKIINYINPKNIGFPLFDGVYYDRSLNLDLNEINNLLSDYKYIKVSVKDTKKSLENFDLPDNIDEEISEEYEEVKKKFEKEHFQTLCPPAFWKQIVTSEGEKRFIQYSRKDFELACEEYKFIDVNDKGIITKPTIFKKWIGDISRRKYQSIDFIPYGKKDNCPDNIYNTFEGFEINKNKNIDINLVEDCNIENIMDYFSNLVGEYDNFKNGLDCPNTKYLTQYIAHMFQYPEKQTRKIICLKGWTGTGKDTLLNLLRELMGFRYCGLTSDPNDLFKEFNTILDSKIAIFLNEMEGKDGVKIQEKLKDIATRKYNCVNNKHEKEINQRNYIRLFILSNNDNPVNIQLNDRRYVVFNSSYDLVINQSNKEKSEIALKFWEQFNKDLKNPLWLEKVYNQLMEIDLSDFCPDKSAPVTKEYNLMKEKNNVPLYDFIKDIYENNRYNGFFQKDNKHYINFRDLKNKYQEYLDELDIKPDFKIKESWIKQKLSICNNSFDPAVRKQFSFNGSIIRKQFCEIDFKKMVEFIRDFIYKNNDNQDKEIIELNECFIDDL